MQKWNVTVTLKCNDTWSIVVFEANVTEKKVDINLDDFDMDTATPLSIEFIAWILDVMWMKDRFLEILKEQIGD